MKLVAWCVAGLVAFGACGKKDEAPAGNVQVAGEAAAKVEAKAAEPTPTAAAPEAKAETKVEAQAKPTELAAMAAAHEGCGGAAAAEGPKDCAFDVAAGGAAGEGGCHALAEGAPATPTADGQGKLLGAAFTLTESKPLASVLATATADAEPVVRVAGTVEKVCQKKGCWMVVRDGELEARVVMKDYAFFIPVDAAGQKVTIEGSLKVKVFTEAQAKHLAEDGNEDPSKVTGDKKEFVLTATSVQLGG
ncbi:MAG: DUF4920 domain-containing protein [Deltaproteobacteria bacterium]|nr:DUF4920 domain-containing protein [Deltaproteobacteria bacterium]